MIKDITTRFTTISPLNRVKLSLYKENPALQNADIE